MLFKKNLTLPQESIYIDMAFDENKVINLNDVVVRFAGDSGDGMQLTGTLFSDIAAESGYDFATFPDYPSEIRAPQGTLLGVSGFQVRFGNVNILTSGDHSDVLVAMNPASLKANLKWVKPGGTIILDTDTFEEKSLEKAGYEKNPLTDGSLDDFNLIKAPITSMTIESLKELDLNAKAAAKSRNMFALGILFFLFNKDYSALDSFFEKKFADKQELIKANKIVIRAGFSYADTIEALTSTYNILPAKLEKGTYRNITGNLATSWGFLAAAERSGRKLFLGSYPITPASEILQELAKHKVFGAKVFQAEDEIAGICSTIGASYAGYLAVTSTAGPGLSLKSEAIGLAVMTELPIVVVNVQRGGPSTGLPTKSEQSDLLQALYGRNGECPVIVLAASSSSNCFYFAYEAAKLAMEHMTPVILLSDGSLANGSEVFKIPKVSDLPEINPPIVEANDPDYKPYLRDEKKLSRRWAVPGTAGLLHRVGGLEKENISGNVSHVPENHQLMVQLREQKVQRVANYIPEQIVYGEQSGDLLIVGWGSTFGVIYETVLQLHKEGKNIGFTHFNYINPLPKNTGEILSKFKKILVCEINNGQLAKYLKINFPEYKYLQYNKIQGLPFLTSELAEKFSKTLEEDKA